MQLKIKCLLLAVAAALSGGCESSGSIIATDIAPPAARYMTPLRTLPKTPEGVAMNGASKRHVSELRGQCVARGRKVKGLQRYARIVSAKKGQ